MSKEQKKKTSNRKRQRRKVVVVILLFVILLILLAVLVLTFGYSKWTKVERITFGKGELEFNQLSIDTEESMEGYTTLALFGLDNRSNGSFESGNSDAIIVASINRDTGEIKMASIYRDTYLDVGDGEFFKANAAYNWGGPRQAINMLNKNLDLNITDYVSVDFNAVTEVVDAVGGIELELTAEEARYTRGYIDEIIEVTGKQSSYPSSGYQLMDGVQATAYARIRYTTGDDFKRTERQREVITKVFEKVKGSDLLTINSAIDTLLPQVSTSLSLPEALDLAADIGKYYMGESTGFPFETETMDIGSVTYTEVPVDFVENVRKLHEFLYENEEYTPSANVEELDEILSAYTG